MNMVDGEKCAKRGGKGREKLKSIRCIHAGIPSRYIMYLLSGKGNPPRISSNGERWRKLDFPNRVVVS